MGLTASRVRTVEGRALRKLRSDARLNRWHDAVIAGESWRGTGLSAWQNGGSVEERAIEWVDLDEMWDYLVRLGKDYYPSQVLSQTCEREQLQKPPCHEQ